MEYIEKDCTFKHEGQTFEAGGAMVSDKHAIGYLRVDREYDGARGTITDWHGKTLGYAHIVARWPIVSFLSRHMHQVEAVIDGTRYTGRSAGSGMIWRGKRKASQ